METTMYSIRSAIKANAIADPLIVVHFEFSDVAKTESRAYAVRTIRNGMAKEVAFRIFGANGN
jgi:hypothetical protein